MPTYPFQSHSIRQPTLWTTVVFWISVRDIFRFSLTQHCITPLTELSVLHSVSPCHNENIRHNTEYSSVVGTCPTSWLFLHHSPNKTCPFKCHVFDILCACLSVFTSKSCRIELMIPRKFFAGSRTVCQSIYISYTFWSPSEIQAWQ